MDADNHADSLRVERQRAASRRYYQAHSEEVRAKRRAAYAADPEKGRALTRAYRLANPIDPELNRQRSRRATWPKGYTDAHYELALIAQSGCCAICGKPPEKGRRGPNKSARLHVDHDHSTGKARGLLCHLCNIGLGHFQDDPELLTKAAAYIITAKERQ